MSDHEIDHDTGRVRPAAENFFSADQLSHASRARRGFMAKALAAGVGAPSVAAANANAVGVGDPAVLNLPAHSTGLGAPVAAQGYGKPSRFEQNLQRRESPGLTRVAAASVSFTPLLDMCGVDRKAGRYLLAEGADGSSMTRTIALDRALDDVMVAWGMNGEMLRPENGYPIRLVVPGVQGVSWVKYLRRLEVGDAPYHSKDEAVHYIDLMPDGQHRQFTSVQEVKSVVTTPSGGQVLLNRGYYNISGLAWSGRGKIKRVDVSTDGGRNWRTATLQRPIHTKARTRFRLDWSWEGGPALLQSRVIDETGFVQPTIAQLRAVRGTRSIYHNNAIQTWRVDASGAVTNVQVL